MHELQKIYESQDVQFQLEATNNLFTDFVNKFEIWQNLEKQHDIRTDQLKAQKKVQEIYESLKAAFETESDEKQKKLKHFMDKLEGK